MQLASYYLAANRPRDANFHLQKAIVEYPDDPDAYVIMADLALNQQQWAAAGLLADRAIALAKASKGDSDKRIESLKHALLDSALVAQAHERWEDGASSSAIC